MMHNGNCGEPAAYSEEFAKFKAEATFLIASLAIALKFAEDNAKRQQMRIGNPEYLQSLTSRLTSLRMILSAATHQRTESSRNVFLQPDATIEEAKLWVRRVIREFSNTRSPRCRSYTQLRLAHAQHHLESLLMLSEQDGFTPEAGQAPEYFLRWLGLFHTSPVSGTVFRDAESNLKHDFFLTEAIDALSPLMTGAFRGTYPAITALGTVAAAATAALDFTAGVHEEAVRWVAQRYPYWPCLLNGRPASFKRARKQISALGIGANYIIWPPSISPAVMMWGRERPRDIAYAYAISLCRVLHYNRDRLRSRIRLAILDLFSCVDPKDHRRYVKLLVHICASDDPATRAHILKFCNEVAIPYGCQIRLKRLPMENGKEVTDVLGALKRHWYGKAAFLPRFSKATANQWWDVAEEILLEKYRETDRAKNGRYSFKEVDGSESELLRLAGDTTDIPWSRIENRILTKLKEAFLRLAPHETRVARSCK